MIPFPLGFYSSNPNGNDAAAMATFAGEFDKFSTLMGAAPAFMNSFTDFSRSPDTWGANAGWSAWSWAQSGKLDAVIPVVGIPLSDGQHWAPNNVAFFQAIIAGTYDAAYTAVGDAWLSRNPVVYFRPGYEANANFMPWSWSDQPSTMALWVQAFQHVATLLRACARKAGKKARIVWNPCCINWTALDVRSAYPGDDYVDEHGADVYSPCYPLDLHDWTHSGQTFTDGVAWAREATNRAHYWEFQNASQWNLEGSGAGWSMRQALNFARARCKPFMICECGSGGDDGKLGPVDDAAFPVSLANMLASSGVPIVAVMIWATDQNDGKWGFLNGDRLNKAAAWRRSFGAQAAAASPATVSAPAGQAAPLPAAPSAIKPVTAGTAVAELVDRNGKKFTLSFDPTVRKNFYGNDTGLASNVYVWSAGDASYVISPDSAWALPTIKLHRNGLKVRAQGFTNTVTD